MWWTSDLAAAKSNHETSRSYTVSDTIYDIAITPIVEIMVANRQ
jgi:hypothetical protein